jgi:hypothetical protein
MKDNMNNKTVLTEPEMVSFDAGELEIPVVFVQITSPN